MEQTTHAHIDHVETADTGGHCLVDLIVLKSGKVVGISEDAITLWSSVDAFWNQDEVESGHIIIPNEPEVPHV